MVTENLEKGYNKEEEYFYRLNKELIEKTRKALDTQTGQATLKKQIPNWMKCPKCGEQMAEVELAGIKVDRCDGCEGIYFDHGELEILMESREPKGFLSAMKRLFR